MLFEPGQNVVFEYTGNPQEVELPKGKYEFQVWGAQGGTDNLTKCRGGYAAGTYVFLKPTTVFVYVGGKGSFDENATGGYNGGGNGYVGMYAEKSGGGGGASDVRFVFDNLLSRFIVAGGGGGSGKYWNTGVLYGGEGGGFEGNDGMNWNDGPIVNGKGGSQNKPGDGITYSPNNGAATQSSKDGSFGKGSDAVGVNFAGGGAGGGYFGGSGAYETGGGGGSGYVSPFMLSTVLLKGNEIPSNLEHTGDGKVIITFLSNNKLCTCEHLIIHLSNISILFFSLILVSE